MKREQPRENTRTHGAPIDTRLSQLPERFTFGPHTRLMSLYLSRRWKAHSYGWFKRAKYIEYNREWTPERDKDAMRWGRNPERYRFVEHPKSNYPSVSGGQWGLRFIGKVSEIRMSGDGNLPYFDHALVDHNGWFIDNFQDETISGEVYQLPARDGKNQYVPAIGDENNDGATLDFHSVTDDIREAIRDADRMAERYAEDEREYRAKEDAKQRIEDIDEEIKTARADLLTLIRELRANCDKLTGLASIRAVIREHIQAVRAQCDALAEERENVEENGIDYA